MFIFYLLFPFVGEVSAANFTDDFKYINYDLWNVEKNEGEITFSDDGVVLSSQEYFFPFIFDQFDSRLIPDSGNFNLKIRFRYKSIDSMGNGIGFGYFKMPDMNTLIELGVWADTNLGFIYQTNRFSLQGTCNELNNFIDGKNRRNVRLSHLDPYSWHVFEVQRSGNTLYLFLDRDNNPSPLLSMPDIQCVGRNIFLGNKYPGGSNTWTSLEIDYVKIEKENIINHDNTKVIILPGLGASWNALGALGSDDPILSWQVPSFVKIYDNLKNAFTSNGFEEDKNLFMWAYDWRKPVNQIAGAFSDYLATVVDSDDEIILVGHSLGGTVARWWYQDNLSDNRVKKVISLGSPHFGAVDAYEAWNGGNVSGRGLSSIVFNILLLLNRDLTETNASVIKRLAPVVKDLQPVFDFAYIEGSLKDYKRLVDFNSILTLKNLDIADSQMPNIYTMAGLGFDTSQFLTLGDRNFFDNRLGLWPDGRPINTTYSSLGDGTVLSGSARLKNNYYELTSNHGELMTKSISQIMTILGLENTNISQVDYDDFEDSLVFYIASPAHLEVLCNTNTYLSDDSGFVVVKNDNSFSECLVRVVADGQGGGYKLVVGSSGFGSWGLFSGQVAEGEVDIYSFDKKGLLTKGEEIFSVFKKYCQKMLVNYPGNIYLGQCIDACDEKVPDDLVKSIFEFRSVNRDFNLSWQMVDKLIPFLRSGDISRQQAVSLANNGSDMFDLVDKVAELKKIKNVVTDDFGVSSYSLAQEVFKNVDTDFDLGDYVDVQARFDLSKKILQQVW